MSASDLVDHFKLDAFYDSLSLMTHETLRVPDQAQHKRQVTVVKQWKRTKSIGRGAFGTVWLDRGEGDEVRAVKEVVKEDSGTLLKINCKRELLALSRLSKVSLYLFSEGMIRTSLIVYSIITNLFDSMAGSKTIRLSSWSWNICRMEIWRNI